MMPAGGGVSGVTAGVSGSSGGAVSGAAGGSDAVFSATGNRAVSASGSGAASGGCAAGSGGRSPSGVCQLISVSLVRCASILAAHRGSQAEREPAKTLGDEQNAEQ